MELGVGQALVSFLDKDGVPQMAQQTAIICPQSLMGPAEESVRTAAMAKDSMSKYDEYVDNISAYEVLNEQTELAEKQAQVEAERAQLEKDKAEFEKQKAKEEEAARKQREKEALAAQKQREKEKQAQEKKKERRREQIERTLINTGAQVLKRGLFKTLFK